MIGVKKKIKRGDFVDISHYKTNDLKIGYQGVKGSFSEEAMISFFGENNKSLNYEKFEDVFISLKNDEIDYGILPFENSCTGAITSVYDLISKYGFYIVGEECIKINQLACALYIMYNSINLGGRQCIQDSRKEAQKETPHIIRMKERIGTPP